MEKYNLSIRIMHLLISILIICAIAIGLSMVGMDDSDYKWILYGRHKTIGILIFLLVIATMIIKKFHKTPSFPENTSIIDKKASLSIYHSLYLLAIILPLTGFLGAVISGYQVHFFDIALPMIFSEDKDIGHLLESIHYYLGNVIIAIILLHLVYVIKLLFINKVNLFKRIFL